ncbi:MAG TPA: hypothetical protein VML94_03825 [Thermoplasmata archaeon]|nr:hypothetical protein [Thermoplasmata archaeon]
MARPVLPGLLIVGGGILSILAGLVLLGTGPGAGDAGIGVGVAIVVVGALVPFVLAHKTALAFAAMVLAVLTIPFALAGFVLGIFLVLLGGMLTYVWVPPGGPVETTPRPSSP